MGKIVLFSVWVCVLGTVGIPGAAAESPMVAQELGKEKIGGGELELRFVTFESGAGMSSGGEFSVTASLGQPEPFVSAGGAFRIRGGFLPAKKVSDIVFGDGFESGDLSRWSTVVGEQ